MTYDVVDICAGSGWGAATKWLGLTEIGIEVMPEAIQTRTMNGLATLLGVNKGTRRQQVNVGAIACPLAGASLRYFGADNRARDAPFSCRDGRVSFDLPGETLFALSWSAS